MVSERLHGGTPAPSLWFRLALTAALAAALGSLPPAVAAETRIAATAAAGAEAEGEEEAADAAVYLSLRSSSSWERLRLEVEGYGRAASSDEDPLHPRRDDDRLYTLLVTASLDERASLAVGRQEVLASTGPVLLDGLSLRWGAGRLRGQARWGTLADPVDEVDGLPRAIGAGVELDLAPGMALALDYARTYEDSDLLTELAAVDWSYSWFRNTRAYVLLNADLMSDSLHEGTMGARLFFSEGLSAQFEHSQRSPVFDATSIYSVFAVDAARTDSFSFLLTPSRNVRYTWEYALESYADGRGGRRYGASGTWTPGASRIEAALLQHKGFGGTMTEVSAQASVRLGDRFSLGAGGEVTRTENPGEDTVGSYSARVGGEWRPAGGAAVTLRLEQSGDDLSEDSALAGRLTVSIRH